jgi:3-methyladenine DNA glycosylase/8-oxoguanine DNA glycosylase
LSQIAFSEITKIPIMIENGPGELIDRITILEIKLENIRDQAKLVNIRHEYELSLATLRKEIAETAELTRLTAELKAVNAELWRIEDEIRTQERAGTFGETFVAIARSVYRTNDRRAAIKRKINDLFESKIVEEKSYEAY